MEGYGMGLVLDQLNINDWFVMNSVIKWLQIDLDMTLK